MTPEELAVREMNIQHCLTLIERNARQAREARCHANEMDALAARSGLEVVSDPSVIAAVRGDGTARIGPSEKMKMQHDAKQARGASVSFIGNAVMLAGRLGELMEERE